ncbi:hypothetical protein [Roseibium marinum]|uniref:Uncharacterized protein n=1 Tax=Roseibium marinum TaxID=281252 RepID=A0A2S3V4I2_9HYPH|nr:hypothetical protein [Roseibium marinum]POF34825.1 hypothetical protein CLV41_1011285 [Roseibium marinum]
MATGKEAQKPENSEQQAAVAFTVSFNRSQSEVIVYGCLLLGVLFAAIGLFTGIYLLALAAVAPIAMAYWHYPMIERGKPQLGANEEGLYVERIGFIDWTAIRMTDVKRKTVRNIEQARLDVLLTRPLDNALTRAQAFPFWKKYMKRNWKRSRREHGRELIAIDLHTLAADPDEILNRIRAFKSV